MKTYKVRVKATVLEWYLVEAESEDEALEYWAEGRFLGSDDEALESEAQAAEEQ